MSLRPVRPTLTAPDDDPLLWLESIDGPRAVAWADAETARTLAGFGGPAMLDDADTLAALLDRPDNIPHVTRRAGLLYNFWRDAGHPRGLWRRCTMESYRGGAMPDWDVLLDLDALAEAEGEDWVWDGATVTPPLMTPGRGTARALLSLSPGGGDAAVLREFDIEARCFVAGGFALPLAKSEAEWLDADTLILSSSWGEGMETASGYARTVRLWRRGTEPSEAPVIAEAAAESMAIGASVDRFHPDRPLVFAEQRDFFRTAVWRGTPSGPAERIDLPEDAWFTFSRDWLAVRPRRAWRVGGRSWPAGVLLGIGFADFLAGSRDFHLLEAPSARRAIEGFDFVAERLLVQGLDDLRPVPVLFDPASGWTRHPVPGLPEEGEVSVWALDEEDEESDGSLLAETEDPLTPPALMLYGPDLAAPAVLRRAPAAFDPAGLAVTRHDATSEDGTRIPYFQVGPAQGGRTGEAPVHMTGYGGFEVAELPVYRPSIGRLWLARGGISVVACLRGGGEFGPDWHEAGRREGKAAAHADFAAVARDLVARGVTRPGRIAAEGGSNGGLLIANMLTRYPGCFGALFCTIPLVDMRRYTRLLAGASWIAEYGDPDDPADWAFLSKISAYHAPIPRPGPPILIATARRDDRVHPGHARKFAARLRAASYPAWYYELASGGHGYGKDNRQEANFTALGVRFLRAGIGWE